VPRRKLQLTELSATAEDGDAASPKLLGSLLSCIQLIRTFEERVLELAADGLVHGRFTRASARKEVQLPPSWR
jgi:TPP-dependent pyruvate/acetoin dehydrogenase alpha subunit